MHIAQLDELTGSWDLPKATEAGHNRTAWSYVGDDMGATNTEVSLVYVPPGNRSYGYHHHETEETYVVIEGRLGIETQADDEEHVLERLDAVYFDPGEKHTYRCVGTDPVVLLSIHGGSAAQLERDHAMSVDEKYDVE